MKRQREEENEEEPGSSQGQPERRRRRAEPGRDTNPTEYSHAAQANASDFGGVPTAENGGHDEGNASSNATQDGESASEPASVDGPPGPTVETAGSESSTHGFHQQTATETDSGHGERLAIESGPGPVGEAAAVKSSGSNSPGEGTSKTSAREKRSSNKESKSGGRACGRSKRIVTESRRKTSSSINALAKLAGMPVRKISIVKPRLNQTEVYIFLHLFSDAIINNFYI